MKIRPANRNDISDLVSIIRNSFQTIADQFNLTLENCPKHPSNCTEAWVQADLDRGVDYFILTEDDRPKGFVAGETKTFPHLPFEVTFLMRELRP